MEDLQLHDRLQKISHRTWWAITLLSLSIVLTVAATASAFGPDLGPTRLSVTEASVRTGDHVRVAWTVEGTEPDSFELHRAEDPMGLADADISTLVTVTPPGSRAVTVSASPAEIAESFRYYYAVVWREGVGRKITENVAPNPHGAQSVAGVKSCEICHASHVARDSRPILGAGSSMACYECHGGTPDTEAYGQGALVDMQAVFFEETVTPMPAGGSRHRNAITSEQGNDCSMCHEPHLSVWSADPALAHPDLLRMRVGIDTDWIYATGDSSFGNEMCMSCHGDDPAHMDQMGGAGAYWAAGGDHESLYSASAHSSADVPGTVGALTQCQACHSEHASPVGGLVDYRGSSVDTTENAESGLCFRCHTNQVARALEPDRGAGKPYTWNGRDVWEEFTRTSAHPYMSEGGRNKASVRSLLSVSTVADFNACTIDMFSVYEGDEYAATEDRAVLRYTSILKDPAAIPIMYISNAKLDGSHEEFHTFEPGRELWNSYGFNPPEPPAVPGSGSTLLSAGDKLILSRGESSGTSTTTRWEYTPPANSGAGSWTTASPSPSPIGTGSDSTLDAANGFAYYTAGEGSSEIMKWAPGLNLWDASIRFSISGVETGLGVGSTIAYSPQADRLFVINGNGSSGDGILYYLDSPSTTTGLVDFTSTGLQLTPAVPGVRHSRMVRVAVGGVDYIYAVGANAAGSGTTQLVSSLAGTPQLHPAPAFPFTWGSPYYLLDGGSLTWDGQSTLYSIKGGSSPYVSWRSIPADPVADSVNYRPWTQYGVYTGEYHAYPPGTSMAFVQADPAPYTTSGYASHGSIITPPFAPSAQAYRLGSISIGIEATGDTYVRTDLQGYSGGSWSDVSGYTDMSGSIIDVRDVTVSDWEYFRVAVHAYSPTNARAVTINHIAVGEEYEQYLQAGSLACVNCHNTHLAEKGSGVWDVDRVADPDDTSSQYTGTMTAFCLECHDGSPPQSTTSSGSYVPYSVAFRSMNEYSAFSGWNKETPGLEYSSSAHATTTGTRAGCETCHDPHGSSNRSLLAWTRPAGYVSGVVGSRDNTSTSALGSNLCLQCHGGSGLGLTAPGAANIATATQQTRGHNIGSYVGSHSNLESPGGRHVECMDCHDPHAARSGTHTLGSSDAAPALLGATGLAPVWSGGPWTASSSLEPTRITGPGGYEAYVCFRCHSDGGMRLNFRIYDDPTLGTSGSSIYWETDITMEFNPANRSGHNIVGGRSNWPHEGVADGLPFSWPFPADATAFVAGSGLTKDSSLTCTDCHTSDVGGAEGPHGGPYPFGLIADGVWDEYSGTYKRWYQTRLGEWNDEFLCGRCHRMNSNKVHQLTANPDHSAHRYFTCASCHVAIPHGWQYPRLLRQDAVAYLQPYVRDTEHKIDPENSSYIWSGPLDKFSNEAHTPTGWTGTDCAAFCHVNNARHIGPAAVNMTPYTP